MELKELSTNDNPLKGLERYKIVLASASPRRFELLSMLDIPFEVRKIDDCDESYPDNLTPESIPEFLSRKKSEAARRVMMSNELIITADTIVIVDGCPIGKPKDAVDAKLMLRTLSGKTHTVITGVTIVTRDKTLSFSAESKVEFADLDDREITFYINHYQPFDKAGAYGIQEWIGAVAIKAIEGSFYNVMGLPIHRLYAALKEFAC